MVDEKSEQETFLLCAAIIVKDEATYIREWVLYHWILGFEHFFIYDNNSTDRLRDELAPLINRGICTYIYWPFFPGGQSAAYHHACVLNRGVTRWLALIDIDEFIVLRDGFDLRTFLLETPASQILMRWRYFGHSGHRERPEGLVIQNFLSCASDLAHIVKSIVRVDRVIRVGVHCSITMDKFTITAQGEPVPENWTVPVVKRSENIEINHYYTRSYSEYTRKMTRPDVVRGKARDMKSFEHWLFDNEDRRAASLAPQLHSLMADLDRFGITPLRFGIMGGRLGGANESFYLEVRDLLRGLEERARNHFGLRSTLLKSYRGDALAIEVGEELLPAPLASEIAAALDGFVAQARATTVEQGGEGVFDRWPNVDLPGLPFATYCCQAFAANEVLLTFQPNGGDEFKVRDVIRVPAGTYFIGVHLVGSEARKRNSGAFAIKPRRQPLAMYRATVHLIH